jgi:hypothetical protein
VADRLILNDLVQNIFRQKDKTCGAPSCSSQDCAVGVIRGGPGRIKDLFERWDGRNEREFDEAVKAVGDVKHLVKSWPKSFS